MKPIEERLAELEKAMQWWRGLSLSVAIILVGVIVMVALIGRRAMSGTTHSVTGDFQVVRAKSIQVLDEQGKTVIAMQAARGGGMLNVTSATPEDHDVLIMANPGSAHVQVSHQATPRPFGVLKIAQRKPVLQMFEEAVGEQRPREFHQFPRYDAQGVGREN